MDELQFRKEIEEYREKETGAVSVHRNPSNHSCDNLLLFSSVFIALLKDKQMQDIEFYHSIVRKFAIEPGRFARYPGEQEASSHDDHTGVAVVSYLLGMRAAQEILAYGESTGWMFRPTREGWLGRIIDFPPTVRAAAGKPLSIFSQIAFALGTIANLFEPRHETSGKILLWLKHKVLFGRYTLIDGAIKLWRFRMSKVYPGGFQEVVTIYYGAEHPFAKYAPKAFN